MRDIIYSAIYGDAYPFGHLAKESKDVRDPLELENPNSLLIIWGGEDISPALYGQKASRFNGATNFPSRRDMIENSLARQAIKMGIPIIGICRGAQLLCAMNGGTLVQHVTGHGRDHYILTDKGDVILTSSMHHQMMLPSNAKGPYEILGETCGPDGVPIKISNMYFGEEGHIEVDHEYEIVWWPDTKCLAIQGHPEYMQLESPFVKHCLSLCEEKFK